MNHPKSSPQRQPGLSSLAGLPKAPMLLLTALLLAANGAHATCPSTPPTVITPVCDGSADDTVALQSMIHAASLNGAPAVIPASPNGCRVTTRLEVCSNTTVLQRGLLRAKTTWSATSVDGLYTIATGATAVRIEGGGIIDGANVAGSSGIVAGGASLGAYPVSPAFHASNVVVHGMTVRNMQKWSLRLDGVDNLRVDGVTSQNASNGIDVGHGTRHATLTGLIAKGATGSCVRFYRGASDSTLTNSIVADCGGAGISVFNDQPSGYPAAIASSDITIDGNIVREAQAGIEITSDVGSASSKAINISANQTHHNRSSGISMVACDNCQITSNMSHHNGSAALAYQAGIFVSNSRQVKINANTVYNEGQGTNTGFGIVMMNANPSLPASTRINVTGNLIYDDQATKSMTAAFGGSLPVPIVSTGNSLSTGLLDTFTYASGSVQRNYLTP